MNKYEVLGIVGEGAYGVVLRCRNRVSACAGQGATRARLQVNHTLASCSAVVPCRSPSPPQETDDIVAIKKFKEGEGEPDARCKLALANRPLRLTAASPPAGLLGHRTGDLSVALR